MPNFRLQKYSVILQHMQQQCKTCPHCKNPKPLSEFDKYFNKKKNIEVVQTYCKECRRLRNAGKSNSYYSAHSEERKQYARNYRADPLNKNKINSGARKHKQRQRKNLSDCYVVKNLCLKFKATAGEVKSIDGIVELERNTLKLKRKIKEYGKDDK